MRPFRWPAVPLPLTALLLATPAAAEEEPSCDDRFVPDRPGATNGHTTVGAGCLHLATSISATTGDNTAMTFPSIVRMGLGRPFELRLAHSVIDLDLTEGEANAAPLGLELKWMALEAEDDRPGTGILVGAFAPTNSDFSAELTPAVTWLFDWALAAPFSWSLNLIASLPGAPAPGDNRAVRFDYGTVISASVTSWLGLYIDGAGGSLLRDGSYDQAVGAGAAFTVLDNLQLDLSGSILVTGDEHPVTFGGGVAWRL